MRKDLQNRNKPNEDQQTVNKINIMEETKVFVDKEQKRAKIFLIDTKSFTGDVRDLIRYGKLLYFARMIREKSISQKISI